MDTDNEILKSGGPKAPDAPDRTEKTKRSGKKSALRQRLRHELDSFNFNALLQGVSTTRPAEETPASRPADPAAEIKLADPARAEDAAAATLAAESGWELIAPAAPAKVPSARSTGKTPANFPGFDLDPRRSMHLPFARASATTRAVASDPASTPERQISQSAPRFEGPPIANPHRKIVRSRQRRRGRNVPLLSLVTTVIMLAVGVAAALTWRGHPRLLAAHADRRPAPRKPINNLHSGGHLAPFALKEANSSSPRRSHHHRRRHHKE